MERRCIIKIKKWYAVVQNYVIVILLGDVLLTKYNLRNSYITVIAIIIHLAEIYLQNYCGKNFCLFFSIRQCVFI